MNHEPSHGKKPFDPADFPALRELFPGYLHQDFTEEYGSAPEAIKGFLADASGDEILQVKEEWTRFRQAAQQWPLPEVQSAVKKLGSAWQPQNEAELKELDEIFRAAET
jgi:hypothetical protein